MSAEEAMSEIVEALRVKAALGALASPEPVLTPAEQLKRINEVCRLYFLARPTR